MYAYTYTYIYIYTYTYVYIYIYIYIYVHTARKTRGPKIPASPLECVRKLSRKLIQNRFKMVSGRCLGDVQGIPGAFRGPVRAGFQTQLQIEARIKGFWEAPRTSREAPGDPEEPQKSSKNRVFWLKRTFQTWIFADFCAQCRFP